jgi:fibronectin-binding autotransporter adhesin
LSEGALYSLDGDVNNLADGTFAMLGAVVFDREGGGGTAVFNNAGTLTKTGTGTAAMGMPLTNTGTVDARAGTLDVNRAFTHADGALVQGVSTLDIVNATYTSLPGEFDADVAGTAGTLPITGNLVLDTNSDLNVDIGGTTGGDYDVITVTGDVTIDGTININPVGGYTPSPGDMVTILTWTGNLTADNGITTPTGWIAIVGSNSIMLEYAG